MRMRLGNQDTQTAAQMGPESSLEAEIGPETGGGQVSPRKTSKPFSGGIEHIEQPSRAKGSQALQADYASLAPFKEEIPCPTCKGRPCLTCGGNGQVLGLVGYLLRQAREKLNPKIDQKKMAELLGISSAYLSTMERGEKRFTEELAIEYVRVLVENGWKPNADEDKSNG